MEGASHGTAVRKRLELQGTVEIEVRAGVVVRAEIEVGVVVQAEIEVGVVVAGGVEVEVGVGVEVVVVVEVGAGVVVVVEVGAGVVVVVGPGRCRSRGGSCDLGVGAAVADPPGRKDLHVDSNLPNAKGVDL